MLTHNIHVSTEVRDGVKVAVLDIPQGDSVITLRIANDLVASGDEVGLGTLLLALNAATEITTTVPVTHETAWRAVANSVNSAAEAFAFSASLYAVETAKPNSLDVKVVVFSAEDITQSAPLFTGDYAAADVGVGYYDLMERIATYHHIYAVDNGVLNIRLVLPSILARKADDFVTRLVTVTDYSVRAQLLYNPTGTLVDEKHDPAAGRVVRVLHLPKYQLRGLSVIDELANAEGGGVIEGCGNEVFITVSDESDVRLATQAMTNLVQRIGAAD